MSMASEFKEFIQRGNVVDMAVGVIIGGAFGKVVSSVVGDVLMPPIGLASGGVDFSQLKVVIGGTRKRPSASTTAPSSRPPSTSSSSPSACSCW